MFTLNVNYETALHVLLYLLARSSYSMYSTYCTYRSLQLFAEIYLPPAKSEAKKYLTILQIAIHSLRYKVVQYLLLLANHTYINCLRLRALHEYDLPIELLKLSQD